MHMCVTELKGLTRFSELDVNAGGTEIEIIMAFDFEIGISTLRKGRKVERS